MSTSFRRWWHGFLGLPDTDHSPPPGPTRGSAVTSSTGAHTTSVVHDPAVGHLLIQRASDLDSGLGWWSIEVDGHQVARLRHQEETWVPVRPGRHTITAGHWGECEPVTAEVTAGETVAFVVGLSSPLWLPGSSLDRPPPPMLELTRTS